MSQILSPRDVAARLSGGETLDAIFTAPGGGYKAKLAGPDAEISLGSADRTVDFVISTESVDRYTDTVSIGGWQTAGWQRNPVVLWAHDDRAPAIGRGFNLRTQGKALCASVEFAAPDVYPFADTVYRLIKAGIIRAASVGFIPLAAKRASDDSRPYGLDISEQELLEWSVVNIPANPDCLTQARSLGIDMAPLAAWARGMLASGGAAIAASRAQLEALAKEDDAAVVITRGRRPPPAHAVAGKSPGAFDVVRVAESLVADVAAAAKKLTRSGRVLSSANEAALQEAHDCMGKAAGCHAQAAGHIGKACDLVRSVLSANDPDGDADDGGGDGGGGDGTGRSAATQARRDKAQRLKTSLAG